jgi:hypothetical protein
MNMTISAINYQHLMPQQASTNRARCLNRLISGYLAYLSHSTLEKHGFHRHGPRKLPRWASTKSRRNVVVVPTGTSAAISSVLSFLSREEFLTLFVGENSSHVPFFDDLRSVRKVIPSRVQIPGNDQNDTKSLSGIPLLI